MLLTEGLCLLLTVGADFLTWVGHVLQQEPPHQQEAQECERTWKEMFTFADCETTMTGRKRI